MPRPILKTRRRIIDSEIAQQKAENDTRVHNAADPPKADRNGKHTGPRRRPPCSRCGSSTFRSWGYDQETAALVCLTCYLNEPQPTASTPLPT